MRAQNSPALARILTALAIAGGLAACGADGRPVPPPPNEDIREGGITISGRVGVGVTGGSSTVKLSGE